MVASQSHMDIRKNVVLKPLTSAQQIAADIHTYSSWGAPQLTLEQYVAREEAIRATEFSKTSRVAYVLVPASDPFSTDILAHIEVFRRPVLLKLDKLLRMDGFSIGSVYTPVAHRKKGYASAMLQQVIALMRDHGQYIVSNLYSDIGDSYYSKKGWLVHRADELTIPTSIAISTHHLPLLYAIDSFNSLEHVALCDLRHLEARLERGQCAFPFTADSAEWFQARSRFYGKTLRNLSSLPTNYGMYSIDARGEVTQFVVWTHNFRDSVLQVLRWDVAHGNEWAFLARAIHEAKQWQLDSVCVWNLPLDIPESLHAYVKTRDESLPSLMVQESVSGNVINVEWVANEKFGWV
jgi:hypothetical protein